MSTAVAEELKGLNDDQLRSIYMLIKSFKKQKSAPTDSVKEIPLKEIRKITSKTKGSWSQTVEDLREERF
jgi:hypothetical protein